MNASFLQRWKKTLILSGALFVALLSLSSLTFFFLQRSGFLRRVVNEVLEQELGSSFSVDDAWVEIWGPRLVLKDLQLFDSKSSIPVVRVSRTSIDFQLNPFSKNFLSPSRCILEDGQIEIPLSSLDQSSSSPSGGDSQSMPRLPEIWVRNCSVQVDLEEGKILPLGQLSFAFSPESEGGGALRGQLRLPAGPLLALSTILDSSGNISFLLGGDLDFNESSEFEAQSTQSLWRQLNLSGQLALRVHGSVYSKLPTGMRVGVDAMFKDFSVTLPQTPFRIQNITGSIAAKSNTGAYAQLHGKWEQTTWSVQARAEFSSLEKLLEERFVLNALLEAKSIPFDERIREICEQDRSLKEIWAALSPQGRCDLSLRAKKILDDPQIRFEAGLDLKKISMLFRGFPERDPSHVVGFPMPIHSVEGEIFYRPDAISIHGVHGKIADGTIQIDGNLFGHPDPGIDLNISLGNFSVDEKSRNAANSLPREVAEVWDSIQPQGKANLDLRLTKPPGRIALRPSARIRPQSIRARYRDFPLDLENVSGEATIDAKKVHVQMNGEANRGKFFWELVSQKTEAGSPPLSSWHGRFENLEINNSLLQALQVPLPKITAQLGLCAGQVGGEIWQWQEHAQVARTLGRIFPENLQGVPSWFPLETSNLDGVALIESFGSNTELALESVRGTVLDTPFFFRYWSKPAESESETLREIQIHALQLPLLPPLFAAIRKADLIGISFLSYPQWKGSVDLELFHRKNRDLVEALRVNADLQDVSLALPNEGIEIGQLNGKISLNGSELSSEKLLLQNKGMSMELQGLKSSNSLIGETILEFPLTIHSLQVQTLIEQLLPDSLTSQLLPFGFAGTLQSPELHLRFSFPQNGSPVLQLRGPLEANAFSTQGGIAMEDAHAKILIEDSEFSGEKVMAKGELSQGRLQILKRRIENLTAQFEVAENQARLLEVSGTSYGGRIRQREGRDFFKVSLLAPNEFEANLQIEDLNLRKLLLDLLPNARELKGKLSLILRLVGNQSDLRALRGNGKIEIHDGALWEVPVFGKILQLMGRRPVFSEGLFSFRIEDRNFLIENFELNSPFLDISSEKGNIGFDGSSEISVKISSFLPIPIVGSALAGLVGGVIPAITLKGPINNPELIYGGGAKGIPIKKEIYIPETKLETRSLKW